MGDPVIRFNTPATAAAGQGVHDDRHYLAMLGERVREGRARRGMTRKLLARDSGVSERYLAQLESGQGNVSILLLRQIARALNLPFRQAHHVTGRIVALAAESGKELEELTLAALQEIEPAVTAEVFEVLGVEKSVRSRVSFGGTAPQNVVIQARGWKKRLADEKK